MSTVSDPKKNERKPDSKPVKRHFNANATANEWKTTSWFLGGALAFLAITGAAEWGSRPAPIEEFGRVGEEFYADFIDPTLATSLEVFVFDADAVKPKEFRIERLANGRWVIPSHHNYPADAEEQLAKTASSVIGIKRGAMVTRWTADHARYGVVNPKQDSLTVDEVDGVGQRLILRGEDESVLADYIVGKQVDGEYDRYYVRHPDEDEVYLATLDIDLSTKFTDWIDTDLFDISTGSVLNLTVNDYSFDELSGELTQSHVTELKRQKTWSDDWQLDSLNEETEELNKDAIRDTLNAISNLEIAGVRAKQPGLTPDLMLDKSALSSQRDVDRLQSDLLSRGFLLQPAEDEDALNLIAREGELYAGTDDGLVYRMHFGRVFAGSEEELEIGFGAAEHDSDTFESERVDADSGASDNASTEDSKSESEEGDTQESKGKPGRYVFVRVDFDQHLLGDEPAKPTEPEKSAELVEAEREAKANKYESALTESEPQTDTGEEETVEESKIDGGAESVADDENISRTSELEKLRKEYEDIKRQYDEDLKKYEDYQEKVRNGKEKAEELNRRFAEWYYVIPGKSYDKLSLARADLVKAKKATEDEAEESVESESTTDETASMNQKEADDFLAENKYKKGVVTTDSGLQYKILTKGEGRSPTIDSMVKVKYKGTLLDGTVFDESGDNEVEFGVGQVINGWTEALQLMKPGSKWKLFIPPNLAYGEAGTGAKIGPNSALIFEIQLISFE